MFGNKNRSTPPACIAKHLRKMLVLITVLSIPLSLIPVGRVPVAHAWAIPVPLSPLDSTLVVATACPSPSPDPCLVAPPIAVPEFSWGAVDGALTYKIQISQNIGFNPVAVEAITFGNKYSPVNTNQLPDGVLYWRVRVESPSPVSDFSYPIMITKQWASQDNLPTLLNPASGEGLDFYDQNDFTWTPVLGAARYRFQIATSQDGFGAPLYNITTLATTHQPPSKLANGSYWWRVIPMDASDRSGTPSESRQFDLKYGIPAYFPSEVPTLLSPAQNASPTFTPTFRWTAVRGASLYRLQYTSDPTCDFGNAGLTRTLDTHLTSHTPTDALPNDINYCWHVSSISGNSLSEYSETRQFVKRWYIQAIPLTPTNNAQEVKHPYFSWTPVPGAAYYKFEVSYADTFPPPGLPFGYTAYTVNPYYVKPDMNWANSNIWYWRVTPYDRNNNAGKPSDGFPYPNPISFFPSYNSLVPHLYYPQYYYLPNSFPPPDENLDLVPHDDRTVPLPIFMWHRVYDLSGQDGAGAFRIQVDDSPQFDSIDWQADTQNTVAVPTTNSTFFSPSTLVYWRVCSLSGLGGNCISPWSQVWITRIDASLSLQATQQITLLRPQHGFEMVEDAPVLEWYPLQGANGYQIQISKDPAFGTNLIDSVTSFTAFAPLQGWARRSIGALDFGTFYWRVRGLINGQPLGAWSAPWRYQLASQSQWRFARTMGDEANKLLVASDPVDIGGNSYDLLNLYVSQDKDYWYFGFEANAGADADYGLYLDLDHVDANGGTSDPRSNNVTTNAAHLPEYVVYFLQRSSSFNSDNALVYRWSGTGWALNYQTLTQVGGVVNYSSNYVEAKIPRTSIGLGEDTGSATMSLFSVDPATKNVQDSTPASTGLTTLDRFTNVSERMNIGWPFTNASGDTYKFPAVPAFFFNFPAATPWEGFNIQIALDPRFTTWLRDYKLIADPTAIYLAPAHSVEHTRVQDVEGDNTYYWRVRPQYSHPHPNINPQGAWSQIGRFDRQGFIPGGLHVDTHTLSFGWDMVEGAAFYEIQVDNDPNFGSLEFGTALTAQNAYTPQNNLVNGNYYWRVRVRRDTSDPGDNDWSDSQAFTIQVPTYTGLTPNEPDPSHAFQYVPTFCWDPMIIYDGGQPLQAAWKYRVQVSKDATFSNIYDNVDTEQSCWTPTKGYEDDTFYWRVAMIDGNGNLWQYSSPAQFTKQYPVPILISPINGATLSIAPTFVWSPVNGASSYRLEISRYQTFSPIEETVTTHLTRYTATKKYDISENYYWRVAIIDRDSKMGPFTDARRLVPVRIFLPTMLRLRK